MSENINSILGVAGTDAPGTQGASQIQGKAISRYRDAYLVAKATTGIGTFVKIMGFVLGFIVFITGFIIGVQDDKPVYTLGGLLVAILIAVPFYVLGVLVSALGQVLKASLDGAVNTSPFLDTEQKSHVMSL